jgi:hypothetical protein
MRKILIIAMMVSFGQISLATESAIDDISGYIMNTPTVSPYLTLENSSQTFCFSVADTLANARRGTVTDRQRRFCVEGTQATAVSNMVLNAIDNEKRVHIIIYDNKLRTIGFQE